MPALTDKVVAVVGSTGGLGTALAAGLTARGAVVVTADRSDGIDIRDSTAGRTLLDRVVGLHGRLDGVVVASGIVAFGDLADTTDVITEELMLTNALGPLWLAGSVLPALAETEGFFAAVTGVVAETPQTGMAPYSASKAALSAGLAAARREFRRRRVTVIDARPPHTETGLATRPLAGTAPRMPTGLSPEHVADVIIDSIEHDRTDIPSSAFT